MTIKQVLKTLTLLDSLKISPKYYKQISSILKSEATTENIRNASVLLDSIKLNTNSK